MGGEKEEIEKEKGHRKEQREILSERRKYKQKLPGESKGKECVRVSISISGGGRGILSLPRSIKPTK
jgi:hypothetical protein